MAVNGSDLINHPWNTTFSPFTDLFENMVGNGEVFFLVPLIILTFGIYIKTESSTMATMFMVASGALLSGGSVFAGAGHVSIAFVIFTAIGIVGLFSSLLFQR